MNANELRIGNILMPNDSDMAIFVLAINSNKGPLGRAWDLELGYYRTSVGFQRSINEVRPARLTEDWLKKFRLEPFGNLNQKYYANKDHSLKFSFGNYAMPRDDIRSKPYIEIDQHRIYSDQLKYVHKIQNLYFELKGEELVAE